jgi:very-short-patch-repair endonuclease
MTDAERLLWSKIRGKQLKEHQFYRQKIIGEYIVDFYPVRNNAPLLCSGVTF